MEEIRKEDEAEKAEGFISVWKLFTIQSLRWQLISTIVLMAGQQLSGVNAVGQPVSLGWQKAACDRVLTMLLPRISEGMGCSGPLALLHSRPSAKPHGSPPDLLLR